MNYLQLTILSILSIIVLSSYYFYLVKDSTTDYFNHPFWFGINPSIVRIFMILQIFAVIGFLIAITSWIIQPPSQGLMTGDRLFYTLILFLISAAIWPIATYYKIHFLVVSSLILTAIASILLLIGSVEESKQDIRWYKIIGILFLCVVSVLVDGVLWNVNYIKKLN
jgi:hypothetical protein